MFYGSALLLGCFLAVFIRGEDPTLLIGGKKAPGADSLAAAPMDQEFQETPRIHLVQYYQVSAPRPASHQRTIAQNRAPRGATEGSENRGIEGDIVDKNKIQIYFSRVLTPEEILPLRSRLHVGIYVLQKKDGGEFSPVGELIEENRFVRRSKYLFTITYRTPIKVTQLHATALLRNSVRKSLGFYEQSFSPYLVFQPQALKNIQDLIIDYCRDSGNDVKDIREVELDIVDGAFIIRNIS